MEERKKIMARDRRERILAVDLGGTNLRMGIYDPYANNFDEKYAFFEEPLYRLENGQPVSIEGVVDAIHQFGEKLIPGLENKEERLSAVALSVPGPFDYDRGVCYIAHKRNLARICGEDLKSAIEKKLKARVFFINDARAFALGAWRSKFTHVNRFVAITLGTGLGCSLLFNGKPAEDIHRIPSGGEIYCQPYSFEDLEAGAVDFSKSLKTPFANLPSGNPRSDGGEPKTADFEFLLSAAGISRIYGSLEGEGESLTIDFEKLKQEYDDYVAKPHGGKAGGKSVEDIAREADANTRLGDLVFGFFGQELGKCLARALKGFRPETVLIGGAICGSKHLFAEKVRTHFRKASGQKVEIEFHGEAGEQKTTPVVKTSEYAMRGAAHYAVDATRPPRRSLLIVPNEDGLGPSSLTFYFAKELLERIEQDKDGLGNFRVDIRNKTKEKYNRNLYRKYIEAGLLRVEPIDNVIRLGKGEGKLGFEDSLSKLIRYPTLSKAYETFPVNRIEGDSRCSAVIDFGTPAAVRAASKRNIPAITVFDHKWSFSYEKTIELYRKEETFTKGEKTVGEAVEVALDKIREDEALANLVYYFPTFVTPEEYHEQWRKTTFAKTENIGGVLGGKKRQTLKIADAVMAILKRDGSENQNDSDPFYADARTITEKRELMPDKYEECRRKMVEFFKAKSRKDVGINNEAIYDLLNPKDGEPGRVDLYEAQINGQAEDSADRLLYHYVKSEVVRYALGFDTGNKKPIIFLSGGGTDVWTDPMWERIVSLALAKERKKELPFNIVCCPTDKAGQKFGLGNRDFEIRDQKGDAKAGEEFSVLKTLRVQCWKAENETGDASEQIRFAWDVTDGTYQELFHGIDLIVSRAGGGTVNDAIACRVPMCCVEEPNHWQVEKIRKNMEDKGLTRTIKLEEFRLDPVAILQRELFEYAEDNAKIKRAMEKIPNRCEKKIVDGIVKFLFERETFFDTLDYEIG